jgi:magnesium transporter
MSNHAETMTGELLAPDIEIMLDQRDTHAVRAALLGLMEPEIADVLIALAPRYRVLAFRLLPKDRAADVFTFLPPEQQELLLNELSSDQLAQIFNEMDPDDRAVLFEEMPGQLAARILALMRPEERRQTQIILGYPAQSVGRIMTPDYLTVRPEWTLQQTLDFIRQKGSEAEILQTMYVVDDQGKLLDDIRLRDILVNDPQHTISTLADGQVVSLQATDDREEAVRAMDRYDRPVLPVVDSAGVLVGIVTFDDVADVAQEETTEDIQKMGGVEALEDPYMSTPLLRLARKRGTWLSVLFIGEMMTASAMGHFEHEIASAVILALFVPLIISSGGNSGSQASTLVIRAMAIRVIWLVDWW